LIEVTLTDELIPTLRTIYFLNVRVTSSDDLLLSEDNETPIHELFSTFTTEDFLKYQGLTQSKRMSQRLSKFIVKDIFDQDLTASITKVDTLGGLSITFNQNVIVPSCYGAFNDVVLEIEALNK
jgi:hypothetical protein